MVGWRGWDDEGGMATGGCGRVGDGGAGGWRCGAGGWRTAGDVLNVLAHERHAAVLVDRERHQGSHRRRRRGVCRDLAVCRRCRCVELRSHVSLSRGRERAEGRVGARDEARRPRLLRKRLQLAQRAQQQTRRRDQKDGKHRGTTRDSLHLHPSDARAGARPLLQVRMLYVLTRRRGANAAHTQMGRHVICGKATDGTRDQHTAALLRPTCGRQARPRKGCCVAARCCGS